MNFATVCSGIGAPEQAWIPLNWNPIFFAEIESFPSAVLAYHYPTVPNYGDVNKFKDWPQHEIDVLCGGLPCQAFSIAGLRKGLEDPRGNLTLVFLGVIDKYKPRYIVYENVPGILSDKTNAFPTFLDGLEELGYVIDTDILDAQFFGVPQRRRRIFVVGQQVDDLLNSRSPAAAQTLAQMCGELAVLNLVGREATKFEGETTFLPEGTSPVDLLQRRLKLFKVNTRASALVGVLEANRPAAAPSSPIAELLPNTNSHSVFMFREEVEKDVCSWEVVPSWWQILSLLVMESKTCPKTAVRGSMTDQQAYALCKTVLHISAFTALSDRKVPTWCSAAALSLNALTEVVDYARQANCNIFTDVEWVSAWNHLLEQTAGVFSAFGYLGDGGDRPEVLSFIQVLCGDNPQSEEEGEDPASDSEDCPSTNSRGSGYECDGGAGPADGTGAGYHNLAVPEIANTIAARDAKGTRLDVTAGTPIIVKNPVIELVTCQNTGQGYWKESETSATLRVTSGGENKNDNLAVVEASKVCIPINTHNNMRDPEKFDAVNRQGMGIGKDGDPAPTLSCNHVGAVAYDTRGLGDGNITPTLIGTRGNRLNKNSSVVVAKVEQPIAFDTTQITSPQNGNNPQPGDPCHPMAATAHPPAIAIRTAHTAANGKGFAEEAAYTLDATQQQGQAVAASDGSAVLAVRRLTEREAEALQGFPSDFTKIPFRGKSAADCPSGNRYKALGNSMACPCLRYIGERIMAIENFKRG